MYLDVQVNLIKNPTISKNLNFPAKKRCAFFAVWKENVWWKDRQFESFSPNCLFSPIPTKLCHVKYCCGDKSYPCLVGIGLNNCNEKLILKIIWWEFWIDWNTAKVTYQTKIGFLKQFNFTVCVYPCHHFMDLVRFLWKPQEWRKFHLKNKRNNKKYIHFYLINFFFVITW